MAMQETHGKDPFEILSWRGKDEILFLPYYDTLDVAHLQYLNSFQIPAARKKNSEARTWVNVSLVEVIDEDAANLLALNHLSLGAEGVVFDVRNYQQTNTNVLMKEIMWPYCSVSFYLGTHNTIADKLRELIKNHFDPASISGALFWESIPKKNNFNFFFEHCQHFRPLGLFIPASTPATEISDALFMGASTCEAFAGEATPEQLFRSISFSFPTNASFLESAAKLKALRMLWFQIAHAYGQSNYKPGDLHIHARSEAVTDAAYAPQENMLKGSFAAIAAITGGCDSLTIECQNQPPLVPRWAKNVSEILKEESFFDQVSDPLAGAYAFDSLVDSLAKKAWELFQLKWQKA